jgi:drug/metabolite transporter (DMT)-like permease
MGILLGIVTALAWGNSDFLARFAARRIGSLRTTLYMQFAGLVLITIFLERVGGWGHLRDGSGWQPWAWGALAGIVNGISTLSLYRSFEIGKMAVVAPISASYPALTVLLSLASGERLTALRAAGVALILIGVVFVARGETESPSSDGGDPSQRLAGQVSVSKAAGAPIIPRKRPSSGVTWAFVSAIGFGVLFWLLGMRAVPVAGFAATVWLIRLTCSILTAGLILSLRQSLAPPRDASVLGLLLGIGVLDTGAFVLNNRGLQLEQVSVVSVLASLYGAVTVLLAAIFLRERPSRWQWLGIVAIFVGIAFLSR